MTSFCSVQTHITHYITLPKVHKVQHQIQCKMNRNNIKLLSPLCCAVLSVILMVVIRYISKVLVWITTILVILGAVGTQGFHSVLQ